MERTTSAISHHEPTQQISPIHSTLPLHHTLTNTQAAGPEGDEGFAQRVLESVIISEAKNVEDQLFILTSQLPQLLADPQQQYGVRLCVLDSMSALFRGEFSAARADSLDRARLVFAMAKQMKRLSHDFALPFVVTNQVGNNGGVGRVGPVMLTLRIAEYACACSLVSIPFIPPPRDR